MDGWIISSHSFTWIWLLLVTLVLMLLWPISVQKGSQIIIRFNINNHHTREWIACLLIHRDQSECFNSSWYKGEWVWIWLPDFIRNSSKFRSMKCTQWLNYVPSYSHIFVWFCKSNVRRFIENFGKRRITYTESLVLDKCCSEHHQTSLKIPWANVGKGNSHRFRQALTTWQIWDIKTSTIYEAG